MTIGIYLLKFIGTTKVYVGQSLRIEERYTKHKNRLANKVANCKLQEAYEKYGVPHLEILLEVSDIETLDDLENEAIEVYNAVEDGFNINSKAGGGGKGLGGVLHPRSKYSTRQIVDVFKYLLTDTNSFKYIEEVTGVSVHTIRDVSKGKAHSWLKDLDEDAYEYLISKIGTRVKNTLEDSTSEVKCLISASGEEVEVRNIAEFSRQYGLNKSHVSGVLSGIRKSHLGWKLKT